MNKHDRLRFVSHSAFVGQIPTTAGFTFRSGKPYGGSSNHLKISRAGRHMACSARADFSWLNGSTACQPLS